MVKQTTVIIDKIKIIPVSVNFIGVIVNPNNSLKGPVIELNPPVVFAIQILPNCS